MADFNLRAMGIRPAVQRRVPRQASTSFPRPQLADAVLATWNNKQALEVDVPCGAVKEFLHELSLARGYLERVQLKQEIRLRPKVFTRDDNMCIVQFMARPPMETGRRVTMHKESPSRRALGTFAPV